MEHLIEVGVFAAKAILIVAAIGVVIGLIVSAAAKGRDSAKIEVTELHDKFKDYRDGLKNYLLGKKELKAQLKLDKKKKKKEGEQNFGKTVYVLDFEGDMRASGVERLRQEITAVLTSATPKDEVVVKVESPGGMVHGYGLAAAQLLRIRQAEVPLTICVDKVAASGGYMMACTANKIIASPFAIVGSIGVLAQIPNFHRLLKKHDVDYQEITAGEYKRTLSIFGEPTEKGKEKFTEQIQDTHDLFKNFVSDYRPQLDIAKVATGEYWYGKQAIDLKLIDHIQTSDDYLYQMAEKNRILEISLKPKKKLADKVSEALEGSLVKAFERLAQAKFF